VSGNSHVQANIIGAGIDQRAKSLASNRRVILKNQIDGRLHAHGDGELAGTGLRAGARGKTEHAGKHQKGFFSVELDTAAHLIKSK